MIRKIGFATTWVGLAIYAFFLAPPNQPDTFELIKNLSIGEIDGINPLIVALFYIMGVWPMIYSCLLFFDGRTQKIPAFPFAALSFGVGAFALLPYLALREPSTTFPGQKNAFLKLLDSRWTGIILMTAAVLLVAYGFSKGDWGDYVYQWRTSRFIHVMSLDFCLLCLLFPALLRDDMTRRGLDSSLLYWMTALIPLFGPLIYLCLRPPLAEERTMEATSNIISS
ncbi:DUF2834 domain-containing protein [Gloeocapsopsis sp. IPPAS B-1203]|uniref:DUF2834 domain-containing protein n=1 Tax=Gloeocapsopsis sp. IPPAS B-1203 TaxID=2049454 RepID=UPI000C1915D6|nr:DUF2834 domain-containing protein [Gloeocapsopsis sp. IPPAS B-1203]PIG90682.1 DUF2834 domain-containing protein [Gloeocapsopsis sp. IPPAS B-1203]